MAKRYLMTDEDNRVKSKKILEEVDERPKQWKSNFPEGFGLVGLVFISKLARIRMPADAYRLAMFFIEFSEFNDGISIKRHVEYAQLLEVSAPRVSELITLLEGLDIVYRLGGRAVMVNPEYYWRGNDDIQSVAQARWRKLKRPEIVFTRSA